MPIHTHSCGHFEGSQIKLNYVYWTVGGHRRNQRKPMPAQGGHQDLAHITNLSIFNVKYFCIFFYSMSVILSLQ